MSDYTLSAKITADVSGFKKGLKDAEKALESLQDKLSGISSALSSLGDGMSKVGGKLTAIETAAGGAAAVGLKKAADSAIDFDSQMRKVGAIAQASDSDLQRLTDTALELGAKTSLSASETAEAMTEMAAKGFDANQIIASMPGVISAAEASGEDLALVADTVTGAINGFGLGADSATHVADVLAESANKTAAGVEDLQYAFKYAAPSAASLGISMEELAAATGVMTDAELAGEQAGTTLRAMFVKMAKPTEQAQKAMDSLGISFFDAQGKMKSIGTVIADLQTATAGMTDEAKQNALATIFGTESLSGLLAMMNKAPGSIEAMTKDLQNCDGASQAAADAMKAGVGGAIENMQGAIETFSITVGDSLLPAIQTAAEITSTVFDQMTSGFKESGFTGAIGAAIDTLGHFADVPEPIRRIANAIDDVRDKLEAICNTKMDFSGILAPIDAVTDKLESLQSASGGGMLDGVIDLLDRLRGAISGLDGQAVPLGAIAAAIAAIGPAMIIAGKGISAIGGIAKVVSGLCGGIGKLAGLFAAIPAPILLVVAAVAALAAGFAYLYQTDSTAAAQMQTAWAEIQTAVGSVISALLPVIQQLGETFLSAGKELLPAFTSVLSALIPVVTTIVTTVAQVISDILPVVTQIIDAVVPVITTAVNLISGILVAILPVVQDLVTALLPVVSEIAGAIGDIFASIMPAVTDILNAVEPLITQIIDVVKKLMPVITNIISLLVASLLPAVTDLVAAVMPAITQIVDALVPALSSILAAVLPLIQQILPVIINLITQLMPIVTQIVGMIGQLFASLAPIIAQLIEQLVPVITNIIGIITNMVTTLMPGITAAINVIVSVIDTVMAVIGALMPVITNIISIVTSVISTVISVISPIISFVAGIINGIMAVVVPIVVFIANVIASIVEFIAGIIAVIGDVWDFISGVLSDIWALVSNIVSKISTTVSSVMNTISGIISRLSSTVSSVFNTIFNTIRNIMNRVKNTFSTVFDKITGLWDGLTGFVGGVFDGIGEALDSLVSGVKDLANTFISGINFAIDVINKIPGVSISPLSYLQHGADNWQGGFARMNEGGRGELVALPSGTQVIPHDVSMQYARESARLNASQTVVFDYAAMAAAVASAMDHVQVSVTSNIDGKTAAKAMTPFINRNLGRQRALDVKEGPMKSIQSFLDTIKGGRYGRDIKSAIHKALDALSDNETELKQAVDGLEIGSGGFALETQSLEYTDCVYNGTAGIYVLSPNSNTEYRISCDTDTGNSAVRCPKLRINLPTDQPRFACRIILHHFSGFQADIGEALSGTEAFTKIGDYYVADTNSGTNEQDTIGISIWHDGQGYRYCCYRPGYAGNTSISEATAAANEAAKAANAARETVEGIIAGLEAGTGTGAKRSVYLDPVNGSDANDGLSWADPMKTIQAAISKYSAVPNLELSLSGGIYSGDIYIGNQCVKIYNLDSESIDATIYGKITVQYGTLILSDAASVISSETAISIENGGCLVASKAGITSTGSDTIPAILVSGNSTAFLNSCTFSARGQSSKILLSAENGSVVRTFACNYGGTASYGIIQAKMASKIVDDTTVMFPTQSNAISGSVIYRNGVQISPYVPPIVDRVTVYLNASTGSDANNGLSVDKPLATVASAFAKYVDYNNIRLQFAAGSYDIGTITAENKKIALVGASAANTTLNGRINLTSCTLTLSALTVVADGTTPIVTASTGSHVYGYRANFTSTGGAECLRVTTASQCYLDGSVFTTANDTDTVVRSSGGALVCLGYCTVPGVLRASTTGLINTVNGTIHDTAAESGGIIWVNGTRVAPVEDTGWMTKTADFDETVNGNTVTTKVTITYRKVGAVASMHAVVNRPMGATSIMITTGGKLTIPTSCAPAYLYHIPETNARWVQMTPNGTIGDQTYFRFDFPAGTEQTDQTYMFDATYFVN